MKILVTGGAGYVGSVLIPILVDKGNFVKCLDRFFFGAKFLSQNKFHGNIEIIKDDIMVHISLGMVDQDGNRWYGTKEGYILKGWGNSIQLEAIDLGLPFDHVTIANNYGGGIYASHFVPGDVITITNSILWDNYWNGYPAPIGWDSESLTWNFTYNDIDVPFEGQGNISDNPRFVASGEGNFNLQESSPCIDAGEGMIHFTSLFAEHG